MLLQRHCTNPSAVPTACVVGRTALSNLFIVLNRRHMFDIVERYVDMLLKQA
jgi:hypothetical protein